MKASDYIVDFLADRGVDVVFGYIGGMITHLVDSLGKSERVQFVQTYHEQTAAIAAEGYAIESGKFGVAIATSGPGATNMMTGIADAYFGNIPVLYITGQVNTYEYKYDKPIRQQGFQETDVVSIVKPITKYAVIVDNADDLRYELEKAIHIATTGRKGPVLIDLPMNISRAEIQPDVLKSFVPETVAKMNVDIGEVKELMEASKYPMVLIGGGCHGHEAEVENFITSNHLPVVTSLMGRGIINEEYEHYMGMAGSYGNRCANMAFAKVDLLIALGSRLDTRQTGAKIEDFMPNGHVVHVDIDTNELDYHRLNNRVKVNADVADFVNELQQTDIHFAFDNTWTQWLGKIKQQYSQENEVKRFVANKAPYIFMEALNKVTKENDIITTDIGQNQMWAAQSIKLKKGQQFITSGGLAPMGFSMPVAIGMAFASPEKTIYCLNGDGGLHMAIQSLMLISQYNLNIKVMVLNNAALGMITQFQHLYFEDRMHGTTQQGGYVVPDLAMMAEAYHIPYIKMDKNSIDLSSLQQIGCCLCDYVIEGMTTVSPKLEYNKPIYKPSPQVEDKELEDNMLTINSGGGNTINPIELAA